MELEIINVTGTEGKWQYLYCDVEVGKPLADVKVCLCRCQVCGKQNRRFTHHLEYPRELGRIKGTFENRICVGVECAALLIDDDQEIPRKVESEVLRKERWRIRYQNWGTCRATIEDLEKRGRL